MSDSENPGISAPEPGTDHPTTLDDWWPERLDLSPLRRSDRNGPLGADYDYAADFATVDLDELKADVMAVMTDSQEWWPADWGHYGPLFIRMAWHSAGTYRIEDGRGGGGQGAQRFAPLNSWPDNASLDKARRLLWPVKRKYGTTVSWADLILFAGNCAIESMGLETFGFAFGREDIWEPDDVDWGIEQTWLGDERYSGDRRLAEPYGAVQMGLIYVNPEGPNGDPDPLKAARDIRETFARMAMDDEETVALIAGGHTFGKCHGAVPEEYLGPEPEACPVEAMGLGWRNSSGTGVGADAMTSGIEGAWTTHPTRWDNGYFENIFEYEWELTESPAGAHQWKPTDPASADDVPDAHIEGKRNHPMMLTTDLALKADPVYEPIARRFHEHPDQLAEAFAKAWFKLLHRDMGPVSRLLGPWVPEPQLWQDPVPEAEGDPVSDDDVAALKASLLDSGLSIPQLALTAWASAASFRNTDKRGGANGARIRLAPQKDWEVNDPAALAELLPALERVQQAFNGRGGATVSLADVIVLAGCAAVEQAAKAAGREVTVPFSPGRTDATQEMTDVDSFAVLEPTSDLFRNHVPDDEKRGAEKLLADKACFLGLSAPEMTALVGGMRSLGANRGGTSLGVLTDRPETLTNDFFVNVLDMGTTWKVSATEPHVYEGSDRSTGELRWTATAADLAIGSNPQLRSIAEVYASDEDRFVADFVAAWAKVMDLDRYDLR